MADIVTEPELVVPPSNSMVMIDVQPDASLATLCEHLITCERMTHRYQWTSGFIIDALVRNPQTPNHISDFVEWLQEHTGMMLSQLEVKRRLNVFKFYARYINDPELIRLIEIGGVKMAFQAAKVIDVTAPTHAREVLQACVANPGAIEQTLQSFNRKPPRRIKPTSDLSKNEKPKLMSIQDKLMDSAKLIDGTYVIPLDTVIELLKTNNII